MYWTNSYGVTIDGGDFYSEWVRDTSVTAISQSLKQSFETMAANTPVGHKNYLKN